MARTFNGTTDKITLGSTTPDLTSSWTWALWFKRVSTSRIEVLVSRWTNSTTNRQIYIYVTTSPSPDNKIQVDIPWISAVVTGSTSITDTNWHHLCVTRSGNNWTIYLDGASDGTATDSHTQETGGTFEFGYSTATTQALQGSLAEVACWSAALDVAEVTALYRGFSPILMRTASLAGYWPLLGRYSPEIDLRYANDGTVTGATQADHPRVIRPRHRQTQRRFTTAAGAASTIGLARSLAGVGVAGGGPFSRANAGVGVLA